MEQNDRFRYDRDDSESEPEQQTALNYLLASSPALERPKRLRLILLLPLSNRRSKELQLVIFYYVWFVSTM